MIGVGFAFSPGVNTIAPDYPDTSFMIVDGYATCGTACGLTNDAEAIPNVADYTFKEQEGSFLVGAAAVLKCQCKTIGFLGGQTGPLIEKFQAGYEAGAAQIDPEVEVLVEYIGDDTTAFNDPVKGEQLSTAMYDDGAEIIYHAAGASGAGLFNAAVEAQKEAIGVDSDQYLTASPEQQPLILTSMLKRVDVAVFNSIEAVGAGSLGGSQVFGMAEDGVDYATSNPEELTADITEQLDEFKQQIIDGTIVVPETRAPRPGRRTVTNGDGAGGNGSPPLVVLDRISKRFPGVVANDEVDLELRPGEVHALIGENGAGKSTLMRVLYGMYPSDGGRILVRGDEVKIDSPRDAIALGIGMVHQHFVLVDPFTVTENIILGEEGGARLDIDAARQRVVELAESYAFRVDPRAVVEDLSVGEEQRGDPEGAVPRRRDPHPGRADRRAHAERDEGSLRQPEEAARSGAHDRLHQPQARRGPRDRRPHHRVAPGSRRGGDAAGRHHQGQARRDDGRPPGAVPAREADGRDRRAGASRPGALGEGKLNGIDLEVRAGEILGVAGVEGNGQRELAESLIGLRTPASGTIELEGTSIAAGRCSTSATPVWATSRRTGTTRVWS